MTSIDRVKLIMEKLKREYASLRDQLVNAGFETSQDEVMWNDGIFIAMDNLLEGVSDANKKLIILNLI